MNYKKLFSALLLSVAVALQAAAYTVTPVDVAPQWKIDWSYNHSRPDWHEPDASAFANFTVMIVTVEEALRPYATADDLMTMFVGDEPRGLASPVVMNDGTTDPTRFLMKVYGNEASGEQVDVTLQYYNAQLQQLFSLSEKITIDENATLGIFEDFIPPFTYGSEKYPVHNIVDAASVIAMAGIMPAEGDIVAAFVDGECRGVSQLSSSSALSLALTVFLRNTDEEVVLSYYDARNHRVISFDRGVEGDVNGDGEVNGADMVALTNVILGKSDQTSGADVNGDGEVNGTDYVILVNMVLGRSKAPAAAARAAAAPAAAAQPASLSIVPFDIEAGGSQEMVISLTNPDDEITLVQFDLRLPAGLALKMTDGDYDYDIAGRTTWRKHSLEANQLADGTIRFLLASSSNAVLSGSEGAIIKMTLVASSSFTAGDIRLENILLVTPNEKEIKQNAYTCTVGNQPPVTPGEPGTARLAVEGFSVAAGGEAELVIDLVNPADVITLVQFDLRLPAGLTLKETDGEYDYDIAGRTTWRKHSLDINQLADGTIRFLLASSSNAALSGSEGAIIRMTLVASSAYSQEAIGIENILLVTPDEREVRQENIVYDPTGITAVTADVDRPAAVYSLGGQRLAAPQKGINIIGGKKVVVR